MGDVLADEAAVLTGAGVKISLSAFPTTQYVQRNVPILSDEPTGSMNIDRTAANVDIGTCFNTVDIPLRDPSRSQGMRC